MGGSMQPDTPIDLPEVLRAECVSVVEVAGWQIRRRPGYWHPAGIMNHHTAVRNGLRTVVEGRADLPGPLANIWIALDGAAHVVAAGRCSHAGPGSSVVLAELGQDRAPLADAAARGLADDTTGNPWFYGIEVDNLGDDHDPYPVDQIASLVAVNVALCRAQGWAACRCIHHREWTRRKIDMSFRGDLRGLVAFGLGSPLPSRRNPALLDAIGEAVKSSMARRSEGRTPTPGL